MAIHLTPFREPAPLPISPPDAEPTIRVGIILAEDLRREVRCIAEGLEFEIRSLEGESRRTAPGEQIQVVADGQEVACYLSGELLYRSQQIQFVPTVATTLRPQCGLRIGPLVAGRIFHWRKEVEQILPGAMEFTASGGSLVGVNTISFEAYCVCVIAAEMGKECPADFLRAQITAARSWGWVFLRNKHPDCPFQICNDDDCQRYQGTTFLSQQVMDLVAETFGHYLIDPQGGVVPAYYSKSCGGHSEPPEAIFGFPVPGLVGVPDAPTAVDTRELKSWITGENGACYCSEVTVPRPLLPRYLGAVDETRAYFRWEYSIPEGELVENLRKKLDAPEISSVIDLLPTARGASGRITSAVLSLRMSDGSREDVAIAAQYDLRRLLHPSFLLSSAFLHRWEGEGSSRTLHLQGAGWGHGVGLCQIGGVGMAITGKNWKEILRHYFPSSELRMEYPKS